MACTTCKVLLFGSVEDTNVHVEAIEAYAAKVTAAKKDVTLLTGQGSHYNSMIHQSLHAGISWLHH